MLILIGLSSIKIPYSQHFYWLFVMSFSSFKVEGNVHFVHGNGDMGFLHLYTKHTHFSTRNLLLSNFSCILKVQKFLECLSVVKI